jgi:ATP-binding cassette subfamily F protein uup
MDKLTDHLFVFKGKGEIFDFPGNYSDYKNQPSQEVISFKTKTEKRRRAKTVKKEQKKRLSYNEKKELESLESEIASLEIKKSDLMEKLNSGTGNHEEMHEWSIEIEQLNSIIDQKELRWLELSEHE